VFLYDIVDETLHREGHGSVEAVEGDPMAEVIVLVTSVDLYPLEGLHEV
jgi:hypothetical protein